MQRCGHIAILGPPNAGKSTLINRLTGSKVSIVSPKEQTTRVRVRGVCMCGESQLIFVDTPGIFKTERLFERGMVREAWSAAGDADAILLLLDAETGLDEGAQQLIEALQQRKGTKVFLAINKVDAVQKPYLLKLATACDAYKLFDQIFMISALNGDGVEDVKRRLAKLLPEGPWLYPEDQLTDVPMRELAAEITREKLFLLLRQELPYSLKVETESWQELPPLHPPRLRGGHKGSSGTVKIMQIITVEREGQKRIVIGAKGAALKRIGTSARMELEGMTGKKIFLELFVKVEENWKSKQEQH